MTRTYRCDGNYEKKANDGKGMWRGCGDKYCTWCISNRTNKMRNKNDEL